MTAFLKQYGATEGPLGFPMPDRAARTLDALLRALPRTKDYEYRKAVVSRPPTELNPGERSDVSWVSAESVDRTGEVVRAKGMNDSQFQANPVVTLGHAYFLPPVGRSLWRRRVKDGDLVGIKAKTQYPVRPDSWPMEDAWPPDKVFALVQAGMLNGKSIGFLPTKVHVPDDRELRDNGWQNVGLVIDEWLLLEYACVFLPANQDALVEAVSKGGVELPAPMLQALGLDPALGALNVQPQRTIAFTPLEEIERHIRRGIDRLDFAALAKRAVQDGLDRARGRV
ncbi:MAG TPA: hypothetical protein VJ739_00805 [Gemmataceae bacterium]|nr:hypothetical protein [Gemmataceae bacterium]